jgi:hypothetical protein
MAEIDIAEIYGDLLAVSAPIDLFFHFPSSNHPNGWYMDV